MIKEILFQIYRLLSPKAARFEHLGRIAHSFEDNNQESLQLAAIYSTGLYSLNMVDFSTDKDLLVDTPILSENKTITQEILDLQVDNTDIANNLLSEEYINNDDLKDQVTADTEIIVAEPEIENTVDALDYQDNIKEVESPLGTQEIIAQESGTDEVTFEETNKVQKPKEQVDTSISSSYTSEVLWEEDTNPIIGDPTTTPIEILRSKKNKKNKGKNGSKAKASRDLKLTQKTKGKSIKKSKRAFEFSPFSNWLSDLQTIQEGVTKTSDKKKSSKKKKKKNKKKLSKVEVSAKKSITLTNDIASDTLAMILANQGHNAEAIDMYKRLIEINPNKRKEYTSKIDQLSQDK